MKHYVWAATLVAAIVLTAEAQPLQRIRLDLADARAVASDLERQGFDVLGGSVTDKSFELVVSDWDLQRLRELGYEPITIAVGRPLQDMLGEDIPPGYPDLAGIINEMTAKANAYPAICQLVDLTTAYSAPTTYEGRHLYAVKVSDNVTQNEDEPAILIIGDFHAREIVAPVICLNALNQLTSNYASDPNIAALVNNNEIWIAPTWNPDGYNYVCTTDAMWRKNRHVFAGGTGVDVNRNFPIGWDGTCAGDTNPASETYKGPSAASEAETQTLIKWSQDRHFARILDYHCYGREVLFMYRCLSHPFGTYLQSEGAALSAASGYGGAVREPSADGEHYQWQIAFMGAIANLIETALDFQPPYADAQAEAALLWPGIVWAIQRPVPLWGYVVDALTGQPVTATISYVGVNFANGEVNPTGRFGRYQAWVPAGTYTLAVNAPGYEPLTVPNVVVTAGVSTRFDLLVPPPPQINYPNGGEQVPVNQPTSITWTTANPSSWRYHVQVTYNAGQIGNVTDSFERTQLGPDYQTGGNLPWTISTQFALVGSRSARAGAIGNNGVSWMQRTASAGNFSFWYLVSSEANADYFNFYIDGNRMVHASGTSGSWTQYSTTLSAGQHVVKWEYAKNGGGQSGNDSVWVDYVQAVADSTAWTDVMALTAPGATSAAWTPTTLSTNAKVRVRSYHDDTTYGPFGESAAPFSVVSAPVYPLGDTNCNGIVDFDDINPFVLALSDPALYQQVYANCPLSNSDCNQDGSVNFDDINAFVALLS